MIIARSPLRISLGGGGTDLPSFYKKYGGFLIAAAIDKYVYVTLTKPFKSGIYLKYSSIEKVKKISDIGHPIIREVLREEKLFNHPLEITTLADIPSGTGLGSSGSFTVALIKGLYFMQQKVIAHKILAEKACNIEINKLKEPSGKQDQYVASYGGLNCFYFGKNNSVKVEPLQISQKNLFRLENNLLLFYTGFSRKSKTILDNQKKMSLKNDQAMINNLKKVKKMGIQIKSYLEKGDFDSFGNMMNEHWYEKKKRSEAMTNEKINHWYEGALKNGAVGGKIVGAGGGGFLMFYAKDKDMLRNYFLRKGVEEVMFRFDYEGAKIIMS